MKSKIAGTLGLASLLFAFNAFAGECYTQCYSDGSCSTECLSEAPAVTPPPPPPPPPSNSGNSCRWAYDGECDDARYGNAKTNACPAFTDNFDCQRPYTR